MVKLGGELICLLSFCLIAHVFSSNTTAPSSQSSTNQTAASSPNSSQPLLSIPLANYYNLQYSGNMQIDSINQSLNLIFDTGSLWIWIPGNKISNGVNATSSCNSSSICSINGYGDALKAGFKYISHSETVAGYLVQDNLTLSTDTMKVSQTFLLATTSVGSLYSDGVCGLSLGNSYQPTLLDNLYNANIISRKTFGLYLNDNSESYGETYSEITFGGPNPTYYTGEFTNVSVLNYTSYWQIELGGMYLNGPNNFIVGVRINAPNAIIASGVNNILMPNGDFLTFANDLSSNFDLGCTFDGSQNLVCNCADGNIDAFPTLSFVLSGQLLTINASLYLQIQEDTCTVLIQGTLDDGSVSSSYTPTTSTTTTQNNSSSDNKSSDSSDKDSSDEELMSAINPNVALEAGSYIILGGVFLRNYYTLFDAESQMVSFATVVHPSKGLITALEVIMIIFAAFISIMFLVFTGKLVRFWSRKVPKVGKSSKNSERRSASIQLI